MLNQKTFLILFLVFILSIAASFYLHRPYLDPKQFSFQAQSFLHGRTNIPKGIDTVDINGKSIGLWHLFLQLYFFQDKYYLV